MLRLAKRLRLKAYYDVGDTDSEEDVRAAATREGRTSALITFAECIDETFAFDSTLTKDDLEAWRRS